MKTKWFFLAVAFALLFSQNNFLRAQNPNKVIKINYKGINCQVLDKKVRVRFKPGYDFINAENAKIQSFGKLTPMLPYKSSFKFNKSMLKSRLESKRSVNEKALLISEDKVLRSYVIDYDKDISPELYCKYLIKNNPDIELAEPYYVETLQDLPNDPKLQEQISLNRIKAFAAWDKGMTGDSSITIGIFDSGMDMTHEDIKDNFAINYGEIPANGIDDDGNGYIDDYNCYNMSVTDNNYKPNIVLSGYEHGQVVGGIIGATTNNGIGIAGLSYKCKIFPVKITLEGSGYVYYTYEALIYGAIRGFDVINLSTGRVSPYSEFEQSVIDFAVQSGCAIVAAGGNIDENHGIDIRDVYYPAAYKGVLAVGAVNESDYLESDVSTLSVQTDVMAPGNNLTLNNSATGYFTSSVATSYACPVGTAFVALIRAKYPNLTPLQAIEFARQCTDDITDNTSEKFFMPGRLNFEKAAVTDPMSIPSISLLNAAYTDSQGNEIKRIDYNEDVIKMKLDAFNYLGAVNDLTFTLSYNCKNIADNGKIDLAVKKFTLPTAESNASLGLNGFSFRLLDTLTDVVFFRVDIESAGGYKDHFIFSFTDIYDLTTFENEKIIFSASDYGLFGISINDNIEIGQGFTVKEVGNMLYSGGIATTIDTYTLFTSMLGTVYKTSDFTPVKRLAGIDSNQMSISFYDSEALNGLISVKYNLIPNKPMLKIDITYKNTGVTNLPKPSVGYVLDFDMGSLRTKNTCGYFVEALPDDFEQNPFKVAAEYITDTQMKNYIGAIVYSKEQSARAQAGSFYSGNGIDQSTVSSILNSDVSYQYNLIGDAGLGLGALFLENLPPGDQRTASIIIGYSNNKDSLAKMLKDEYSKYNSVADEVVANVDIYPNPAKSELFIEFGDLLNEKSIIDIYNINGNKVMSMPVEVLSKNVKIDIKSLSSGTYYLKIDTKYLGKFVKE